MGIFYIIIAVISLVIAIILLIYTIKFLVNGAEYFHLASTKLSLELEELEDQYKVNTKIAEELDNEVITDIE